MIGFSGKSDWTFLSGGGEMGVLTSAHDWNTTTIGLPENWPQSLRTALGIALNSKFPMFIFWGSDLICFYNDAYRPSLGNNGKHPSILGLPAQEAWPEIWHIIKPLIDRVFADKEGTWSEDQLIPIYRNGKIEDVYWTFSYSPVMDETNNVAGILVTCSETTEKVLTLQKITESEQRFKALADNIPNLAWMANADGWIYWYNKQWYDYTGTKPAQMEGWGWQSVHDPVKLPGVLIEWQRSIASGTPFEMVFPLLGADGQFRQFLTRVVPLKDNEGNIYQWFGTNTDITEEIKAAEVLKESEERFRTMAESTDVLIAVGDETGNAVYFNKAYYNLLGRPMEDLLLNGWGDLVHPEERESFLQRYLQAFEKKESLSVELRILNKKGEYSWLLIKGHPRFYADGTFAGYTSSCVDITELKTASYKKDQLTALIEASTEFIGLAGVDTSAIYVNPVGLAKLGWDNWEGRHIIDFVYPADRELAEKILERLLKTGISQTEIRFWNERTGVPFWLQWNGFTIKDAFTHKITALATVSTDITERKNIEEALRESEKRFRNVANGAPVLIWMAGTDKLCYFYNTAWLVFTGRNMEQEYGNGWYEGVHPDDVERGMKMYVSSFNKRQKFHLEYRLKRNDGEYRWISENGVPRFTPEGIFEGYIGACMDIQEQKMFSDELEKQVEDRTAELQHKNIELENINKELESFAYISSHDLQEPLRKIQTFSMKIMEQEFESLSDNAKDKFQRMNKAAKRMQDLIDDLLTYSRTNSADKKLEPVNIGNIVEEVKDDLKEELQFKGATVEVINMCTIPIIPFQFRQLMHNLISNSLKFSKPEAAPHIKIKSKIDKGSLFKNESLAPQTTYCHINVSDNGIGFEPHYNRRIFDLFQRLHGRSEYDGTGIGLAIVKKIVENHHGIITATSALNEGATFDIYIPVEAV